MENTFQEDDSPGIGSLLDSVLQKYGLQEDIEQIYKKIKEGNQPNKTIITYSARELIEKKITEENFLLSLAKKLNIPRDTAQKIVADLKISVLPYIKNVLDRRKKLGIDFQQDISKRDEAPKNENKKPNPIIKNPPQTESSSQKSVKADKYREEI